MQTQANERACEGTTIQRATEVQWLILWLHLWLFLLVTLRARAQDGPKRAQTRYSPLQALLSLPICLALVARYDLRLFCRLRLRYCGRHGACLRLRPIRAVSYNEPEPQAAERQLRQ